jgi:thiol-disulfide isomerase/thioredoxin
MAVTPSNMIPLGTKAPDFRLLDTRTNKYLTLNDCRVAKNAHRNDVRKSPIATVIMFLCNHCPFVIHIQTKIVEIAKLYQAKGISFIAICSNDVSVYPQDGPAYMRVEADKHHYTFPYLYDETQEVAKAYQAACTPDIFVFDAKLQCVYRGRFDDATPGNQQAVTGYDLSQALDSILSDKPISPDQTASVGCNIKWKKT